MVIEIRYLSDNLVYVLDPDSIVQWIPLQMKALLETVVAKLVLDEFLPVRQKDDVFFFKPLLDGFIILAYLWTPGRMALLKDKHDIACFFSVIVTKNG